MTSLRASDVLKLAGWRQLDPLAAFQPTPTQLAFLEDTGLRRLLRGPNQVGKTETLCADVLDFMLRRDRWQPGRTAQLFGPFEVWVVCSTWDQYRTVCKKMHETMPEGVLAEGNTYNERIGFAGQAFTLTNGNLCRFKTQRQEGTGGLESGTLAAAWVDEPPTEGAWSALSARVMDYGGPLAVCCTPINRPVGWLRDKVEAGEVTDHHLGLTPATCTPVGSRISFRSAKKIAQFVKDTPAPLRPQRVHGAWEGTSEGRRIWAWDPEKHLRDHYPPAGWRLAVGMDYGLVAGKMAAVLVAVNDGESATPSICFMDEAAAGKDETWSALDLARAIKDMLQRNGLNYHDIDVWVGDRSARSYKTSSTMDRKRVSGALRSVYGLGYNEAAWIIAGPPKDKGSVVISCDIINDALHGGRAWMRVRCKTLAKWAAYWEGNDRDPLKDVGDAARYAVMKSVNFRLWREDYKEAS